MSQCTFTPTDSVNEQQFGLESQHSNHRADSTLTPGRHSAPSRALRANLPMTTALLNDLTRLSRDAATAQRAAGGLLPAAHWDALLAALVHHLPHVDRATLTLREGAHFRVHALCGYPEALRGVHLPGFTERAWYGGPDAHWHAGHPRTLTGRALQARLDTIEASFGPLEHYEVLRECGHLDTLQRNTLVPLALNGSVQAHLNLDSETDAGDPVAPVPEAVLNLFTCLLEAGGAGAQSLDLPAENRALRVIAGLSDLLRPLQDPQELLRTGLRFAASGFGAQAAFLAGPDRIKSLTGDLTLRYSGLLHVQHPCWTQVGLQSASLLIEPFGTQHLILAWPSAPPALPLAATALRGIAERAQHATLRAQEGQQLREARDQALEMIGALLEARDLETQGHTQRVAQLARRVAQQAGLNTQDTEALYLGALLHDVGKVGLPDHVLLKAGPLSEEEWAWVRTHPRLGHDLAVRIPNLPTGALDVVLHHHERWDGGGYPMGLSGERIPLLARLFCVIDAFDAMTSARPYKPAWTSQHALKALQEGAGQQFDPAAVRALMQSKRTVE
ncbi:HD-GYP domain-containing protein [Deinococcus sp. Arct2-2]|uniref:HD-GYP domain-containing protein n=1 Tax=Deinococcus sp. Arct2-2 TaxID=2568653 RepID=UPI0010A2F8A9|nr:HD-GYP domain-containing protein [Deinococcus sp. Arct2-2]THF68858.1 HD-GYP domain-containing protein [Deinococcus sp. Arct2-2]